LQFGPSHGGKYSACPLKDLGVTLVGHRRRLLDAIAALGTEAAIDGGIG
jgi:SAM domain (Sterile alpha motif)